VLLTEEFEGYRYNPGVVHGGTLVIATPSDPPEQQQWNAGATASYDFLIPMNDYLVRTDPIMGGPVPWIAESWEVSEDKLTYTVHLVKGVRFHDGTELISEDVKWCYDFVMANDFTRMSDVWQRLSRVNPTEIIDDYTLRFHLSEPYVSFPSGILGAVMIQPKHVWEEIVARPGFDWLTYVPTLEEQVGCGPFKLAGYVPNAWYKFEAFDDYWHGKPYVDVVIRPIITSGDAELLALKRGDVDIFTGFLAPEAIPGLLSDESIDIHLYNSPYMYHWGMNNYKWPFSVKEFRLACAHAIDKQEIVDTLLLGYGIPGTCDVLAPFYDFWFNPNVPVTYYHDTDRANEILDDLGWVDTDDDGVREGTGDHAGEPLAFDIAPPIYDPVRCRAAELLSEWFSQIGVDATVVYMEWATLWGKITQPMDSPTKIDSWILGSSQSADPSWMHTRLHSDNIPNPNYYGFINAEYDELALLQGTQFDSSERQESIWRIQEILAEEVPLVVLYFRQSPSVYRTDKLTGWIMHFSAGMNNFWNYINVRTITGTSSPVADANGPYEAYEGSEITFDASASSDPDEDALQYRWDFTEDGVWDTALSSDPTATYTWFDDYSGVVTVFVTDGQLSDTASANVIVYNVDPIPYAGDDIEVNEGDEISFEGSFYDPGMDTFTVVWNQLRDDGDPVNGEPCKSLPQLTLNSVEEGSVILNMTIESNDYVVNDLHLKALNGTIISIEMDNVLLNFNNRVLLDYDFTDMQQNEERDVLIGMEPEAFTVDGVEKEVWKLQWHLTHEDVKLSWGVFSSEPGDYFTPFPKSFGDDCGQPFHLVLLRVWDDDGGYGFDTRRIVVNNVAPTVYAGEDKIVFAGEIVQFEGSFEDPGYLDTHEITWDFGNGITAEGTLTPNHAYINDETYTVTLTVVDDDGGSGSDTLTMEVHSIEAIEGRLTSLEEQLSDLADQVTTLSSRITTTIIGGLVVGLVIGVVAIYTIVKRKKD
jgi:peptide/nickel transport system substrate-binding protein